MKSVNTYLNFPGNTEDAFNHYRSIFGGDFKALIRFKDAAGMGSVTENIADKIMHIALEIADGHLLMGTDAIESMGHKLSFGNNSYIILGPDSKAEAEALFAKLSEGGKIEQSLVDTSWGSYFGSCADKFGVQWMIDYAEQSPY